MGDEQVGTCGTGLLDHLEGGVDGGVDAADRLLGVARHQPDAVPGLGGVSRKHLLERAQHMVQPEGIHVGPAGLEPTTPAV